MPPPSHQCKLPCKKLSYQIYQIWLVAKFVFRQRKGNSTFYLKFSISKYDRLKIVQRQIQNVNVKKINLIKYFSGGGGVRQIGKLSWIIKFCRLYVLVPSNERNPPLTLHKTHSTYLTKKVITDFSNVILTYKTADNCYKKYFTLTKTYQFTNISITNKWMGAFIGRKQKCEEKHWQFSRNIQGGIWDGILPEWRHVHVMALFTIKSGFNLLAK